MKYAYSVTSGRSGIGHHVNELDEPLCGEARIQYVNEDVPKSVCVRCRKVRDQEFSTKREAHDTSQSLIHVIMLTDGDPPA